MDSAELKAFLSQLQTAQDAEAAAAPAVSSTPMLASTSSSSQDSATNAPDHDSIMQLLATLQPLKAPAVEEPVAPSSQPEPHEPEEPVNPRRKLTYAQSLPLLGSLSKATFEQLAALKQAQDNWELRTVDQRNRIASDVQRGVVSEKELVAFDKQIIAKFDELKHRHQVKLEEMGIPCIYPTQDPVELARQRKVMHTLQTMLDDEEDET